MNHKLSSHIEDYLETIYLLEKGHGHAHVRDIADKLKIKMPSVTEILKKLRQLKLINYQKYGFVTLSKQGMRLARSIYKRHKLLYKFLHNILGINASTAEEDACKIEHVVNPKTLRKLRKFVKSQKSTA